MESTKGSEFVLNYIHLLCLKCHKINLNHGGSYIDSPNWIKKQQWIPSILKGLQKLSLLWIDITGKKEIFHQKKTDWKRIEKNSVTIALNVLYVKSKDISTLYFKT